MINGEYDDMMNGQYGGMMGGFWVSPRNVRKYTLRTISLEVEQSSMDASTGNFLFLLRLNFPEVVGS